MDLNSLHEAMLLNGYTVENLIPDGEYQRFEVDGHKGQPGYYCIRKSASGLSAVYGDFVSGNKFRWTSGTGKPFRPEEKEALKKQLAKEAAELEIEIERKHEKGAMSAKFFWNTGEDIISHDYLKSKQVQSYGLKRSTLGSYAGWLMVPGYDADGKLVTVQYIDRNGQKRFEAGAQKKGAFFTIPGDDNAIIIGEGYSTVASIHASNSLTAVAAFDAGNLPHVAKIFREKHPDAEIIMAADNDAWKPEVGNTGVESAKAAAIEIEAKIAIPSFKDNTTNPTDFNDLARLEGLEAVNAQIGAALPVSKIEALKTEIQQIINLDPLEREIHRVRLANKYGVRKSAIDQFIIKKLKNEMNDLQSQLTQYEQISSFGKTLEITVHTNKSQFGPGDDILIFGTVNYLVDDHEVGIVISESSGKILGIAKIPPNEDKSYGFAAKNTVFRQSGDYSVHVYYGGQAYADTDYSYRPITP